MTGSHLQVHTLCPSIVVRHIPIFLLQHLDEIHMIFIPDMPRVTCILAALDVLACPADSRSDLCSGSLNSFISMSPGNL